MRSERSFIGVSRAAQRRNVAVLALALCLWLCALAMHVHAPDEQSDGPSHACSFCLVVPSAGAPPHVRIGIQPPLQLVVARVSDVALFVTVRHFPASYLSRAPPAR